MSELESYDCGFLQDVINDGRVSFGREDREAFSEDEGPYEPHLPDAVVWPASTEEVSRVLATANERRIPVTPRSGGSSIAGNPIPVSGGIVLNTSEMDAVEVRKDDLQAIVEPGIIYDDLNEHLAEYGLQFGPGIGSGHLAMIGGMISNNASGLNAVRYGVTGDHVRRLEVVLPDGRVVECGRNVTKSAAGYNLKDLFVGSEGTLGVITEATLSLEPLPTEKRAMMIDFPSREAASKAVSEIITRGLKPGAIEYVDTTAFEVIDAYHDDVAFSTDPSLIIELHGQNKGIEDDVSLVREICESEGATNWEAVGEGEMERVWQARSDIYPATEAYFEDREVTVIGDVVVPVSKFPEIVRAVAEYSEELDVPTSCVAHAGDGNLHFLPVADTDDEDAVNRANELNEKVIRTAIDLGGTSTGEHGVGLGKRKFMRREHGQAVDVMASVKDALDPKGIMNPRKVLPTTDDE